MSLPKRKKLIVIILVVFLIPSLYYYLRYFAKPSQTAKENFNLEFKSLSYQKMLNYYPYYDPVFDNSETNNNVFIQDTGLSSEEISRKLVEKLLNNYLNTTVENEKIDGYIIYEIKIIKEAEYGAVFSVLYSVKVNVAETRWGNPAIQPDLAVGKQIYASYVNENNQFMLNIIGANPIAYYEPADKPYDIEIASNLFVQKYLKSNLLPEKSDGGRLLQYKIDEVYEKNNWFHIMYSVQGIEGKTAWDAGSGDIGENGWINNKRTLLKIVKYGDFYEGVISGP